MTIALRLNPRALQSWRTASLAILLLTGIAPPSLAVETTFTLDQQQSELTINATTTLGDFVFEDDDTQDLGGTLDAAFEFGTTGVFPESALINITGSAISPLDAFSLTLGSPPTFGVNVSVTGAVADVTTPSPPVMLTRLAGSQIVYTFDASGFDVTLNQGTVVTSGAISQTIDLAANPVTGTAAPGTMGSVTITPTGMSGAVTMVDAVLELPILFTQVISVDDQDVTLDIDGDVYATSSFSVVLSGLPGDFNGDNVVDSEDLNGDPLGWQVRYGDDLDGSDFLIWQQNFSSSAATPASSAVPEPATVAQLVLVLTLLGSARRRNTA